MANERDEGLGERLVRSSEMVTVPDHQEAFERLQRRRSRKQRNERLLAASVSLVLVGALVAGSLTILRSTETGHSSSTAGGNGARGTGGAGAQGGVGPAGLEPGQYLYVNQTLSLHGNTYTTETWWATDGSGRLRITCSNQNCQMDSGTGYGDSYGSQGDHSYGPGQFPTDSVLGSRVFTFDQGIVDSTDSTPSVGQWLFPPAS